MRGLDVRQTPERVGEQISGASEGAKRRLVHAMLGAIS